MIKLYQVIVRTERNANLAVGPSFSTKQPAEMIVHTINNMIKSGKEKTWHDPTVMEHSPLEN